MKENTLLSIVSPVYNEEAVVGIFIQTLYPILEQTNMRYEIIFVNDGSTDNTLKKLLALKKSYPFIRIINFSRNFGKEAALTAGIEHAKGDAIIPIDADLQHPPETILKFIEKWKEGYDVVVGKRLNRTGEHPLKKLSAKLFYKAINALSETKIPADVGDFRLIDKKVAKALKQLPENQRFMKGLFEWVGFKKTVVEYYQNERVAGKSTFNGWSLWKFAMDGVTSFSTLPLRVWFYIGLAISSFSLLVGIYIIIKTIIFGIDTPGYASTMVMILFFGGIQLLGIGILGKYIGRMYQEIKRRPIYIIESEY
ncbi:MAG: glycosyltransferase family 2 protein [Epsilonproteobacteria bacterium]|nr:glycosyltransferase family 2 protein [Campylobacterota bacterium]